MLSASEPDDSPLGGGLDTERDFPASSSLGLGHNCSDKSTEEAIEAAFRSGLSVAAPAMCSCGSLARAEDAADRKGLENGFAKTGRFTLAIVFHGGGRPTTHLNLWPGRHVLWVLIRPHMGDEAFR